MNIYITIDGGTTNTRVCLVRDKKVSEQERIGLGAKDCIENKALLCSEIKNSIDRLLKKNNLCEKDVECIIASGMITSEFGLCSLEHIKTPAGLDELNRNMYQTCIKEVSEIPFVFIRGVKKLSDTYEETDMMRGEETELMGIISHERKECVYILPGSHSKVVKVDNEGRIVDFSTMLTGEMIAALSKETILKDAVDLKNSVLDNEFLIKGYDYCMDNGINKALFKVRILNNIYKESKDKVYSFFMGIILCGEITQIIKTNVKTAVIGGRTQIKKAVAELLNKRSEIEVITLDDEMVESSTALGAIRIFENNKG